VPIKADKEATRNQPWINPEATSATSACFYHSNPGSQTLMMVALAVGFAFNRRKAA